MIASILAVFDIKLEEGPEWVAKFDDVAVVRLVVICDDLGVN